MDYAQDKVENNILHIVGKKKKTEQLNLEVKVIRMERQMARYVRKFNFPKDSNLEDIKATYKALFSIDDANHKKVEAHMSPLSHITLFFCCW